MDFITEVLDQDDVTDILGQMDAVLEQYRELTAFTQLNEGVLDNLSDDLIQKVSEIQRRIEVIKKARGIVAKLQKSGGFSKEEVTQHRARLRKNKKALSAALRRTQKRMDQFQSIATKAIDSADKAGKDDTANPESDVDLRAFGRLAPFVLRKAAEGGNVDELDDEKYGETVASLKTGGLVDDGGQITDKGQAAWETHNAKKSARKDNKPARDPMDDLADMGAQSDAMDDLAAFG